MNSPRNRQEFLALQEKAAAAARDMQRRATLPPPPAKAPPGRFRQEFRPRASWPGAQPHPAQPMPKARRPDGLHHRVPKPPPSAAGSPQGRRRSWEQWAPPPPREPERRPPSPPPAARQRGKPPPKSSRAQRSDPLPPQAMGGDLFALLSGLGGGFGGAAPSPEAEDGWDDAPPEGEGADSVLMLLLMFLLKKDNADPGLMMALMYIMM